MYSKKDELIEFIFFKSYHSIPNAPKIPYPSESAQQTSGAISINATIIAIFVKKLHSWKIIC